jgi:hypothetical protein
MSTASGVDERKEIGLAEFTAELFEPLLGQTLEFGRPAAVGGPGGAPARMTLIEVLRSESAPDSPREPFSLLFVMKDQAPLGVGLHSLSLPGCESVELFISRITAPKYERKDPGGMFYQAVFS